MDSSVKTAPPTTGIRPNQSTYSSDQPAARPQTSGPRGKKVSDYGRQLSEKQKAKREYGLREAQFRRYFVSAAASSIATGQALLTGLERRLDNVLYRGGVAKSRAMARQMVTHGLVLVNGVRITIPSYAVTEGTMVALKKADTFEYNKDVILPDWLSYSPKTKSIKVERLPKADDLVTDLNTQLIIEFYSR